MLDKNLLALPGASRMLALLCVLTVMKAAAIVGQAYLLACAVDLLRAGAAVDQAAWALAGFLVCVLARQAVVFLQDARLEVFAAACVRSLRTKLLGRVFAEGPLFVRSRGTGNVVTLALEGIEQVETYIRLVLPKMAGVLIVPLVILVYTFTLDWVSGLIMLVVFPFIIFYMVLLGKTAKAEADKQHDEFNRLANHFVDTLRGVDTLKLFGRSAAQGESVFAASERLRVATMKTLRTAILSGAVLDLFATFSVAAVAIMLGFRLVDGSISFFPALLVLVLVPEYFKPIREYASDYHASLDGKTALGSLVDAVGDASALLPVKPPAAAGRGSATRRFAVQDPSDHSSAALLQSDCRIDGVQTVAPSPSAAEGGSWSASSVLRAEGVSFDYADRQALERVSFDVTGFAKVGIVGMSGSGKSTLANLLGGFAEPSTGGFSVALREGTAAAAFDLGMDAWRRQLAYIPQDPYIFHATLRQNIAFYRPDASDSDVTRAVEVMGLEPLVDELPQGLDTPIGEGARALSGGQAQRIALARAFLDPSRRVLLFDEPTAHLDIETELELKERMLPLMEGRLVFFATHRLHWIHNMDLVMVLEGGRLVEFGRPAELLTQGGALARLAHQMEGDRPDGVCDTAWEDTAREEGGAR